MGSAKDPRFKRSEESLQAALLRLLQGKALADISVSELAREAQVSRGTFYAHYENVNDVYEQLVERMLESVQTFDEHFSCASSKSASPCPAKPYCERIRAADDFAAVAREPRFLATVLALIQSTASTSMQRRLVEEGLPDSTARALMIFQMSGCHAVATSQTATGSDWPRIRSMIDAFIEGGLEAVRKASVQERLEQRKDEKPKG